MAQNYNKNYSEIAKNAPHFTQNTQNTQKLRKISK